ncbi:MAG: hypothetical protein NT077_04485 [Candidatus Taylorbacteria bacterium]|nr:hypothetical protein [Candidatus Taylorbacteria bacterium]
MSKFVNKSNTQLPVRDEYAKVISKIADDGVCPFCPEHLAEYHKKPFETKKFWVVTDNMYPYKPSLHHRLIIHIEHITHIDQVSPPAWHELMEIFIKEVADRKITGGTLIMRFGETKFTGASVSHLHAHIVQSNPDDPAYDKVKGLVMRIG